MQIFKRRDTLVEGRRGKIIGWTSPYLSKEAVS